MLESRVYWRNGKLRWLSRRFHTLIWRPGDTFQLKSGVSCIIWESWQHLVSWDQENCWEYRDGGIMELRWRFRNYRRGLTVGVVLLRFWERRRYKRIVLNNTRWCSLLLISFNCILNVIVILKLDTFQRDGKGLAHEMFFCLTFSKQFYSLFFVAPNSIILFSQYFAKIFVTIIVNWMESGSSEETYNGYFIVCWSRCDQQSKALRHSNEIWIKSSSLIHKYNN